MLYETIFQRKSVRKYEDKPIEESILNEITDFASKVRVLFEDIKYEIKILDRSKVTNNWSPKYVAFYSEKKMGYLYNAGYIMQQLDLFIQSKGLGSCWLGFTKPNMPKQKYGYVIMIAFGYPQDKTIREQKDFKRKKIQDIGVFEDESLLEAVRLAPSAVNSQPWHIEQDDNVFDFYQNKKGIKGITLGFNWNKIDMGIAILHFDLALKKKKKKFRYFKKINYNKKMGYEYILSIEVQK